MIIPLIVLDLGLTQAFHSLSFSVLPMMRSDRGSRLCVCVSACLTIINDSSQHAVLLLASMSVVGQTLQVSETGGPFGAGCSFAGFVLHASLLTVSPSRTRPAHTHITYSVNSHRKLTFYQDRLKTFYWWCDAKQVSVTKNKAWMKILNHFHACLFGG